MQSNLFDLSGRVAIITGGAGLLGQQHAAAIKEAGGIPVIWDIVPLTGDALPVDITNPLDVERTFERTLQLYRRVDILINNAARDSRTGDTLPFHRLDPLLNWHTDISIGLTGAFLCSQDIGGYMAEHGGGVIINIGSDFAHIAPNPKHYAPKVKPASYSVVKYGLLGLTRYLAAYWGAKGVRCNMLSPGGVENGQPREFVETIAAQNPLGRMAEVSEYRGAIQFLCSDASRFMNGHNLIIDGGRSVW